MQDFQREALVLGHNATTRGYPKYLLQPSHFRALFQDRDHLLQSKEKVHFERRGCSFSFNHVRVLSSMSTFKYWDVEDGIPKCNKKKPVIYFFKKHLI